MKNIFKKIIQKVMRLFLGEVLDLQHALVEKMEQLQISIGELQNKSNENFKSLEFRKSGYKVFSQWNEDGLIQYLIQKIPEIPKTYIEFGVENYSESNTRYLMMNDHWKGLIIDGSEKNINFVKNQNYFWQNDLIAVNQFIDADNINTIFKSNGFIGNIGLLSIDIDGNDYWILERIKMVSPVILILEFNNLFGSEKKVTIPYEKNFQRFHSHFSGLYYGASLPAFIELCNHKGYSLVGTNNICNNAFFVRNDYSDRFKSVKIEDVFIHNPARESRNQDGHLSYVSNRLDQLRLLENQILFNIETQKEETVKSIFLS